MCVCVGGVIKLSLATQVTGVHDLLISAVNLSRRALMIQALIVCFRGFPSHMSASSVPLFFFFFFFFFFCTALLFSDYVLRCVTGPLADLTFAFSDWTISTLMR